MSTLPLKDKRVLHEDTLGPRGGAQATSLAMSGAAFVVLDRPDAVQGQEFAAGLSKQSGTKVDHIGQDLNDLEASLRRIEVLVANAVPLTPG